MDEIDRKNLPKHIAITMDGNGRWAKAKGKNRAFGHKNGVQSVRETVESAVENNIEFLTLYAFSTENWLRPKLEVNSLMNLLVSSIISETKTLMKNDIKLMAIGEINKIPKTAKNKLDSVIEKTQNNSKMTLILAISYSGRWEILNAVKKIIKNNVEVNEINEHVFEQYLNTKSVPDPELVIRTSGEHRISNFLLWQIAYSELYFTKVLWPDFRKKDFVNAIIEYQKRDRRFGQ
jgi:undecaprenyl diphosphate synthase